MSAAAYLVIRCDAANDFDLDEPCGAEAHWGTGFEPHTHTELRRLIREHQGWTRKRQNGRLVDLCPDHS